jgi:SagB-type dehydrogenase family enzyme
MSRISLGNPRPRRRVEAYAEHQYERIRSIYLPLPDTTSSVSFFEVVNGRETRRPSGYLDEDSLAEVLWHAARKRASRMTEAGSWEHRAAPSAGGKHPIDLLITGVNGRRDQLYLYEPRKHLLVELALCDEQALLALNAQLETVLPHSPGITLWFAAQFGRTFGKYERGESLVWRDAGALLATLGLVAEALGLAFCGIGITGEPHIGRALGAEARISGVGGCQIGLR